MTNREKLLNILQSQPYGYHTYDEMADYLIANGVTVQNWIPVEERLPEKYISVLGKTTGKFTWVISFDGKQWEDNYGCYYKIEEFPYWMPLPEVL